MIDDLLWILHSPSLMREAPPCTDSGAAFIGSLSGCLDLDALGGVQKNDLSHFRLGIYYENLVNHILTNSTQFIDIQRNIQVVNDGVTLGEFDFIGRSNNASEPYDFHLECAIKFYLCRGDGSQLSDFMGPGKRDRLDIKYEKMMTKQLKLSQSVAGQAVCHSYGFEPHRILMLLQGYLFYPYSTEVPKQTLHDSINPDHSAGWWIYEDEINSLSEDYLYGELQKPNWLSSKNTNGVSLDDFIALHRNINRPILVCRLNKEMKEVDRGFIVPKGW